MTNNPWGTPLPDGDGRLGTNPPGLHPNSINARHRKWVAGGGGQGTNWTPDQIAPALFWLKPENGDLWAFDASARNQFSGAADGLPRTLDLGPSAVDDIAYISSILDLVSRISCSAVTSGAGTDTANTSSCPRYIDASQTAFGRPGLLFDGSSYLQFQLGGNALSGEFTVGLVFSATADASSVNKTQALLTQDEVLTDGIQCYLQASATSASVFGGALGFGPASNTGTGTFNYPEAGTALLGITPVTDPSSLMGTEIAGAQMLIFTFNTSTLPWTYSDGSGLAAVYSSSGLRGTGVWGGAETTDEANFGGDTFARVCGRTTIPNEGGQGNRGGNGFQGVLYELIVWNQSFNPFQIEALTQYFKNTYLL